MRIPYVLQLNKRDLPSAMPAAVLTEKLQYRDEPVFEAVATRGDGVFDTLKAVVKKVLLDFRNR